MSEFKSGFVAMLGRTNVGKSTLVNLLVGEKVAATANKVQTTRTAIRGIVNRENSQIIFIDTPGIHKPKTKLNETMIETSFGVIKDIDLILFVIEATSDEIGRGDMRILEKIKESKKKAILIINKIDLVKKESLLKLIDLYQKEYNFEAVIPVSSIKAKYRDIILDEIEKVSKEHLEDDYKRHIIENLYTLYYERCEMIGITEGNNQFIIESEPETGIIDYEKVRDIVNYYKKHK